ncbi:unnamed protein product [Alopecurus aequalis]
MPPGENDERAPPVSGPDRLGALPDDVLHHVLSFLPVESAVRTCVLARRWRHLWRSTTGLRIVGLDDSNFQDLRWFMEHLLILRERTNLDTVEIKIGEYSQADNVHHYVNLWIRYAVICKVQVLKLDIYDADISVPLFSRHLRTLDLQGVFLRRTFLDFAKCPALEDLKMSHCYIDSERISSHYLKHLSISDCQSDLEVHVSTPGLVSLELVRFIGTKPFLEDMPFLDTAYVDLDGGSEDVCLYYGTVVSCGDNDITCVNCVRIKDDRSSDCVLLNGISSAKHLKLLSEGGKLVFTRELKNCPTFSKLKTLLLNEYWCEAPNLDPLGCILKNSPVLEKLTLQLFSKGPNLEVEMKGSCSPMEEPSAISKHLNMVEIKWFDVE